MSIKTITFFTITFLMSGTVYADHDDDAAGGLVLISTTSGGLTTTGGAIGGGITTTMNQRQVPVQQVVYFLKQNRIDFRAALQMGSGAVLQDFTRLIGFKDTESKTVAKLLRKNRKFVNEKAITNLTIENTKALLTWIETEMG